MRNLPHTVPRNKNSPFKSSTRSYFSFTCLRCSSSSSSFFGLFSTHQSPGFHNSTSLVLTPPHSQVSPPITDASINPFYQGHWRLTLSVQLCSTGFGHRRSSGNMVLSFQVSGQLRWKVGTWVFGKYRFSVDCVSVATFGATPCLPLVSSKEGTKYSTWMRRLEQGGQPTIVP